MQKCEPTTPALNVLSRNQRTISALCGKALTTHVDFRTNVAQKPTYNGTNKAHFGTTCRVMLPQYEPTFFTRCPQPIPSNLSPSRKTERRYFCPHYRTAFNCYDKNNVATALRLIQQRLNFSVSTMASL